MLINLHKKEKGFTLIELLVVIAIIGLLASTVLASMNNTRQKGRDARRLGEIKQLQTALEMYRNQNDGNYPCATANPGCASAGAAAQVTINDGGANQVLTALTNVYKPQPDIQAYATGTVFYRVRSTAGASNDSPDRSSYSILARFETDRRNSQGTLITAGSWCHVGIGTGHTSWSGQTPCF